MRTENAVRPSKNHHVSVAVRLGLFMVLVALIAVPLYTASSAPSRLSAGARTNPANPAKRDTSDSSRRPPRLSTMRLSTIMIPMPSSPGITTFAADCTTPQSAFVLGDTVCAHVTGGTALPRRLTWVDPAGFIRETDNIISDPQDFTFVLPATQTSVEGNTTVDNRGTWKVNMISSRSSLVATTVFIVTDPAQPAADLSVNKSVSVANSQVVAGSSSTFQIEVRNNGPQGAANVVLTDVIPGNTTFGGLVQRPGGPTFSCDPLPAVGGTGTVTCTLASMASGDVADFDLAYGVNAGTPTGTMITNTATVSSDTNDPHTNDNSSTAFSTVVSTGGGGSGICSVGCPDDIFTTANTTQNNQEGAIVHFSPPSGNTECGAIVVSHCNDCFFPTGITTVTATAATGDGCSFNVTVNAAASGTTTISCPANQTANADNNCQATVAVGTATATGNNVTVIGTRSDGQPMYTCDANGTNCTRNSSDAPFSAGTTTITWIAYSHDTPGPYASAADEEAHRTGSASCTQTVTVNDVTPPVISATDSSASADANCQAPVPDYTNTVTDNCACASSDTSNSCAGHSRIAVTQDPAAGTLVGLGPHTVHITANDGSSNNNGAGNTSTKDVTFTVNDTTPPTITCPANITTNTDPGICAAAVATGTATATDNCDSNPTITATRSDNQPLIALYPKGTTTITWTATDASGNHSSCTQTVTVVDNEPPVITFNGQTPSISPPNHSYHTFTPANFISSVSDNCDSVSVSDVYITSATSDEPNHSGGSGNTTPDIVIASNCKSVQLRAERVGGGNGRVYTIYFKLKDTSGNFTTGSAKVIVPVESGGTAVDDGPAFTVTSGCP